MFNLRPLLNRLYLSCFSSRAEPVPSDEFSIKLSLNKDYSIDIKLNYPSTNDATNEDIVDFAEKYAELLLYINSPIFKQKLIDHVATKQRKATNTDEQLFFNNVLVFYDVLKAEISKLTNSTGPLIRPSSVFNTTGR